MKPHCLADIGAFTCKNSSTIALIWHSISLLTIGSTEIGRYPEGSYLFVPLGIGVILPIYLSVGSTPVDIELLNSLCSGSAMLRDIHLSIFDEIPSLPVDLVVSRLESSSKTDSSVHNNSIGHSSGGRWLLDGFNTRGCLWLKQE